MRSVELATVRDLARPRWHSWGGAGEMKVLSSCSPFSPTSCWDPPQAKPNQEVRGPRALWTRPMPAGLPGPKAPGRRAISRAGGQRTWRAQGDRSNSSPSEAGVGVKGQACYFKITFFRKDLAARPLKGGAGGLRESKAEERTGSRSRGPPSPDRPPQGSSAENTGRLREGGPGPALGLWAPSPSLTSCAAPSAPASPAAP